MYERPSLTEVNAPPTPDAGPPAAGKRPWVKPAMRPKQFLETLLLGLGYSLAVAVLLSLVLLLTGSPVMTMPGEEAPALMTQVLYQIAAYPLGVLTWSVATWALVVFGFMVRGWLRRYFDWLP